MKVPSMVLSIFAIAVIVGCVNSKQVSQKASYEAEWSNYQEIQFDEALAFLLNTEMITRKLIFDKDYNKNQMIQEKTDFNNIVADDEKILDEYMRSTNYDEYKARMQTKHKIDEFKREALNKLKRNYNTERKYVYLVSVPLKNYDNVNNGFRLENFELSYFNKKGKTVIGYARYEKISHYVKDVGFIDLYIKFNNSGYILPMNPESATSLLKKGAQNQIAAIMFSYKITNCRRSKEYSITCDADISDGYVYDQRPVYSHTVPIGKLQYVPSIYTPTSQIKNWAKAR